MLQKKKSVSNYLYLNEITRYMFLISQLQCKKFKYKQNIIHQFKHKASEM